MTRPLSSFQGFKKIKVAIFDFDGVFTDNAVLVSEIGQESVRCSRLDGFGISSLAICGIRSFILTTETKPIARQRSIKLGIDCFDSIDDKLSFANAHVERLGYSLSDCAFIGNDINDLKLLEQVGLPVVVPDAHSSVLLDNFYCTEKFGGQGCVRELCDYLAGLKC